MSKSFCGSAFPSGPGKLGGHGATFQGNVGSIITRKVLPQLGTKNEFAVVQPQCEEQKWKMEGIQWLQSPVAFVSGLSQVVLGCFHKDWRDVLSKMTNKTPGGLVCLWASFKSVPLLGKGLIPGCLGHGRAALCRLLWHISCS